MILPVILEDNFQNPADIFNRHGTWPNFIHETNHRREQITLVVPAELLPSHRERRTRQAARDNIYASEARPTQMI